MFSRTFWFHVTMIPFVVVAGLVYSSTKFDESILCAYLGMSAAITSRFWFREILEWKNLIIMIVVSAVVVPFVPEGSAVRLLSEFVFWWGVCGIPLRATLRPSSKRNQS